MSPISRYARSGLNNPDTFERNWNRTLEHAPPEPVGAALLLHGLTDSPYSMRAIGGILFQRGFHTVYLRLPGHGTTPYALTETSWRDWTAAVRVAAKRTIERSAGGPFVVVGYSNGSEIAFSTPT